MVSARCRARRTVEAGRERQHSQLVARIAYQAPAVRSPCSRAHPTRTATMTPLCGCFSPSEISICRNSTIRRATITAECHDYLRRDPGYQGFIRCSVKLRRSGRSYETLTPWGQFGFASALDGWLIDLQCAKGRRSGRVTTGFEKEPILCDEVILRKIIINKALFAETRLRQCELGRAR